MVKNNNYKKKEKVFSIVTILLICSVSVIMPITHANIVENTISNKLENPFIDNDVNKLKKSINNINQNKIKNNSFIHSLLNLLYKGKINQFFNEEIIYDILLWLDYSENNLKNTINSKILPLLNEMLIIANRERSYEDLSQNTRDILHLIVENSNLKLSFPNDSYILNNNYDFEFFEEHYNNCDEYWHVDRGWSPYDIFGISENTYEDFSTTIIKKVRSTFFINLVLILLSFFIIYFGDNTVDVFGWLLIAGVTLYSSLLIAYLFDCHYGFDLCQMTEPNIIIHIVDEKGIGINGLEVGDHIKAWNDNAYKVCENTGYVETVWQKKYFTYLLSPTDEFLGVEDENGWYSLSMRKYDKNIYEQAPCPPGKWIIEAGGNSDWKQNSTEIEYVYGKETIIIDNFQLEST